MTIKPLGDSALLIEFEQKISSEINKEVTSLYKCIKNASISGVTDFIPAYCSLTICYDMQQIRYQILKEQVELLYSQKESFVLTETASEPIVIPVCFEETYAPDLNFVCEYHKITSQSFIQQYTAPTYRVYMLGFLPGFTYMGRLPEMLFTPRKKTPRLRVPEGSVGLAGIQTGVYPSQAPGGWQLIGRTPIKMFDPNRESPFLCKQGDSVKFEEISREQFEVIFNK